ncbi:hypothetical protein [Halalkalibacter flavus]|uniref:hypothetical protein n=1 Tax=Halalkalibacter flavus TaxID=3090668 RepID=UPI002FC83022
MIKDNQKIQMTWNPSNKKHFVSRGYVFTKIYDEFQVEVEDLNEGSNKPIIITCDYCGRDVPRPKFTYLEHCFNYLYKLNEPSE